MIYRSLEWQGSAHSTSSTSVSPTLLNLQVENKDWDKGKVSFFEAFAFIGTCVTLSISVLGRMCHTLVFSDARTTGTDLQTVQKIAKKLRSLSHRMKNNYNYNVPAHV